MISRDKYAEMDFITTRFGYRFATSLGGSLTGRGGNLLILDDPIKAEEALSDAKRSAVNDWFSTTALSRLDDKRNGVIILIMQRLHLDDLAGYAMQREPWVVLSLPAIAEFEQRVRIGPRDYYIRHPGDALHEAREGREDLIRRKRGAGPYNFSAQYQQRPVPLQGEIVHWEWFKFFDQVPRKETGDRIVDSWDTALKAEEINDYSVCTTWLIKGNEYYLIDLKRERLNYPDLKRAVIDRAASHRSNTIIIEDSGSGTALIQDLARERYSGVPKPIAFQPEGSKVTRMNAESDKIASGQVFLLRDARWLEDLRLELLQFPYGRHDDQVDSISQFLNWVSQRRRHKLVVRSLYSKK